MRLAVVTIVCVITLGPITISAGQVPVDLEPRHPAVFENTALRVLNVILKLGIQRSITFMPTTSRSYASVAVSCARELAADRGVTGLRACRGKSWALASTPVNRCPPRAPGWSRPLSRHQCGKPSAKRTGHGNAPAAHPGAALMNDTRAFRDRTRGASCSWQRIGAISSQKFERRHFPHFDQRAGHGQQQRHWAIKGTDTAR